jgi:hypothetical protein
MSHRITITRLTDTGDGEHFLTLVTEADIADLLHEINVAYEILGGTGEIDPAACDDPCKQVDDAAAELATALSLGHVGFASDHARLIGFGEPGARYR